MWVRIRVNRSSVKRQAEGTSRKPGRRSSQQPQFEALEDRQLLTATLQSIPNLTVPAQQGYTQPLLAATGRDQPPDFHRHLQQPGYRSLDHSRPVLDPRRFLHRPRSPPANSFTGSLTFQLFNSLTPNTVSMINEFTNDSYYVTTGKYFPRIVTNFGGTTFYRRSGRVADPGRKRKQRPARNPVRQ